MTPLRLRPPIVAAILAFALLAAGCGDGDDTGEPSGGSQHGAATVARCIVDSIEWDLG